MPEYLAPGVYVEEISTGPKPIEGVSTSTAGFAGCTERGPTTPRLVTSWIEFQRWFGGHLDVRRSLLPFAVQGFFENGGKRVFLARVAANDAKNATLELAPKKASDGDALVVTAIGPGEWGNNLLMRISDGTRSGTRDLFRMTILYYRDGIPDPFVDPMSRANRSNPAFREADAVEDYDNLTAVPGASNYVFAVVNSASRLVQLGWKSDPPKPARPGNGGFSTTVKAAAPEGGAAEGGTETPAPAKKAKATASAAGAGPGGQLSGGTDGAAITVEDVTGRATAPPNERTGLAGLEAIDEISLLAVPDEVNDGLFPDTAVRNQVTNAILDQCERLRDRFAILSVERGKGQVQEIQVARDTSYGAIYYPWIRVFDPRNQDTLLIPATGHVAGIYARTDIERGVHKAPANEVVRGIITRDLNGDRGPLEFRISKGEHDILNPRGIDVIRDFRSDRRGIRVWGARTMSSDGEWKYVNVRRLFIFVEESIDEGTQWVVFEPNDEPTWARVRRSVENFLMRVWRDGALMGLTQDEAFFVKCDRTTMTQDDIDNGRLICYIGIAPVKPAEFVIFRISQKTADAPQ